jgi:hypothetical protein
VRNSPTRRAWHHINSRSATTDVAPHSTQQYHISAILPLQYPMDSTRKHHSYLAVATAVHTRTNCSYRTTPFRCSHLGHKHHALCLQRAALWSGNHHPHHPQSAYRHPKQRTQPRNSHMRTSRAALTVPSAVTAATAKNRRRRCHDASASCPPAVLQ